MTNSAFRVARRVGEVASTHTTPTRQTLFAILCHNNPKAPVFRGLRGERLDADVGSMARVNGESIESKRRITLEGQRSDQGSGCSHRAYRRIILWKEEPAMR